MAVVRLGAAVPRPCVCDDDKSKAAAAARIGPGLVGRKRAELAGRSRSRVAHAEALAVGGEVRRGLVSGLSRPNGWTIAEHAGT